MAEKKDPIAVDYCLCHYRAIGGLMLNATATSVALALLSAGGANAAPGPATEAIQLFNGLCVNLIRGWQPDFDPTAYRVQALDPAVAKNIGRDENGPVFAFTGLKAGTQMLVRTGPGSMVCILEIAQADPQAIDGEVSGLVDRLDSELHTTATEEPAQARTIDGYPVVIRNWRFGVEKQPFLITLSSTTNPQVRVQEMISLTYVK